MKTDIYMFRDELHAITQIGHHLEYKHNNIIASIDICNAQHNSLLAYASQIDIICELLHFNFLLKIGSQYTAVEYNILLNTVQLMLCASFPCNVWIQTVRKWLNWVLTSVTLIFDLSLTLTFCMDITSVNGNNLWKFNYDAMIGTWWKSVMDGWKDGLNHW